MPPEDQDELAIPPASPEELARAQRHRSIIILSMVLLIAIPLGAAIWVLLR